MGTFDRYRQLLRRIDGFSSLLLESYAEQFACGPGCSDCCRQQLTVLPVEFFYLRRELVRSPELSCQLAGFRHLFPRKENCGCVLLRRNLCLLYHARPIICRTHGLPLLLPDGDRDVCPKNFTSLPLETLPPVHLLHLDRLNTMLWGVNALFAQEAGVDPGARLPLAALLEAAERLALHQPS